MAVPFYIPTTIFQLFHILTNFGMVNLFNFSRPSGRKVLSHWEFNWYFPDDWWCWTSFHVLVFLLLKRDYSNLCPFLKIVLSCLFFFLIYFYLFMAVLGLRFCARAFSSCGKRGPLFITVRGPLTIAACPVAEHRLQTRRLSNCGSRA